MEQKTAAVKHYLEHGRSIARTRRALGYSCKDVLRTWCDELIPETRKKRMGQFPVPASANVHMLRLLGLEDKSAADTKRPQAKIGRC